MHIPLFKDCLNVLEDLLGAQNLVFWNLHALAEGIRVKEKKDISDKLKVLYL
jgi:hypothetical protein